jgi:hypothetical protein
VRVVEPDRPGAIDAKLKLAAGRPAGWCAIEQAVWTHSHDRLLTRANQGLPSRRGGRGRVGRLAHRTPLAVRWALVRGADVAVVAAYPTVPYWTHAELTDVGPL